MLFRRRPTDELDVASINFRRLDARWHAENHPFTMNDNLGPGRGSSILVERGSRPLVFSAPHAVHHFRRGGLKTNDANTGGLAIALARQLGGSVLALRRGGPEFGDPNADAEHPLKQEGAAVVGPGVVLADLHGMADREVEVIIGLGAAPNEMTIALAQRFVEVGVRHGIAARVADDDTGFNGAGSTTMTTWAAGRGATSLQFEIARRLRSVTSPVERRVALLRTFVETFA